MKSHSRRHHHQRSADPFLFDYALLSSLYIHEDGNDVLDFGGTSTDQVNEKEAWNLIRKGEVGMGRESTTKIGGKRHEGIFIHFQGMENGKDSPDNKHEVGECKLSSGLPKRGISRLVSIEDTGDHFWLMTQSSEDTAPYARMFDSVKGFVKFIKSVEIKLPQSIGSRLRETPMSPFSNHARDSPADNEEPFVRFGSPFSLKPPNGGNSFPPPIAKWIDIQVQFHDSASVAKLKRLLSLFSIHQSVVEKCLYLSKQDSVDMSHLAPSQGGYMFFIISCTPLHAKLQPHTDPAAQEKGDSSIAEEMEPIYDENSSQYRDENAQAGIMELRFEAVRKKIPRSCVPDPISVGVILFSDWVLTIHDQPFAEMDDLLRVIQIQCTQEAADRADGIPSSPIARAALMTTPSPKRFTTAFVFSAFLQICIGHNADSLVFAEAINNLSDVTFDVKVDKKDQRTLLKYVTSTRLCFGECSADVLRRETVVTEILRNDGPQNFLVQEQDVRAQLTSIQSYLQSLKNEICEGHDAITLANWYANMSYYWILLQNGNRSLRMLLLLAEMVNVLTVVSIVQSIFSMNVRIPYDSTADPPSEAKAPFYVIAGVLLLFMLWCVRIVRDIFFRKRFETVALF